MKKVYPYYPQPISKKTSILSRYFKNRKSWLNGLFERSYTMKMGEFKVPLVKFYIANEPSLIKTIMISDVASFPKHSLQYEIMKPLLGDSIFTTNGAIWKEQRELLNPSFEMSSIKNLFYLMNQTAEDMIKRLELYEEDTYVNVDTEMTFTTADIIFRTILSTKLEKEEGDKIIEAFEIFQEKSSKIAMQKLFKVPELFRSKKLLKEYERTGKIIRDSLQSMLEPRFNDSKNGKKTSEHDILSFIFAANDRNTEKDFSMEELLNQIAMLFLAGHETTATSMSWTLYLLALYPKYQEEAYDEVMKYCKNDEFTVENIKKLSFVMNVYKESLRLYPPVNFLIRETAKDMDMRDKYIKKGSIMMVSPWLMHRNERYWEDPHMFEPHRFDNPKYIEKYTYFPFGLGQRICVGAGFATQETTLLLATILRTYKLELKPGFVPDLVGRLTTRSLNGIPIKLIKRV